MPQVNEFSWLFWSIKFMLVLFILMCSLNFFYMFNINSQLMQKKFNFNLLI